MWNNSINTCSKHEDYRLYKLLISIDIFSNINKIVLETEIIMTQTLSFGENIYHMLKN